MADIGFPIRETGEKTKSIEDEIPFSDLFATSKRHTSAAVSRSTHRKPGSSGQSSTGGIKRSRTFKRGKGSDAHLGSTLSGHSRSDTSASSGTRSITSSHNSHTKIHHHHPHLKSSVK